MTDVKVIGDCIIDLLSNSDLTIQDALDTLQELRDSLVRAATEQGVDYSAPLSENRAVMS